MSVPPNIDLFNRFCLAVFQRLYLSFPTPTDIDVNMVMMSVIPDDAEYSETFNALLCGGDAIKFLEAEGFLIFQNSYMDGSEYLQVRLTMKGLAVLGSVPGSLEKRESLISKIMSFTGKGLKDAASEQISELSNQAFALALTAAPALASTILHQ